MQNKISASHDYFQNQIQGLSLKMEQLLDTKNANQLIANELQKLIEQMNQKKQHSVQKWFYEADMIHQQWQKKLQDSIDNLEIKWEHDNDINQLIHQQQIINKQMNKQNNEIQEIQAQNSWGSNLLQENKMLKLENEQLRQNINQLQMNTNQYFKNSKSDQDDLQNRVQFLEHNIQLIAQEFEQIIVTSKKTIDQLNQEIKFLRQQNSQINAQNHMRQSNKIQVQDNTIFDQFEEYDQDIQSQFKFKSQNIIAELNQDEKCNNNESEYQPIIDFSQNKLWINPIDKQQKSQSLVDNQSSLEYSLTQKSRSFIQQNEPDIEKYIKKRLFILSSYSHNINNSQFDKNTLICTVDNRGRLLDELTHFVQDDIGNPLELNQQQLNQLQSKNLIKLI